MYFLFGFLFLLCLVFFIINHHRKKRIIKKLCLMSMTEKCLMVNELVKPFGYCYDACQDIFSSTIDAWQREFGYRTLYDKAAAHFNMVFDREPVYFDYNQRTWLIEFWKGQYGINTGGEVGIYYADSILSKENRTSGHYHAVSEKDMLPVSFQLFFEETGIASVARRHWWLTAFSLGMFAFPSALSMKVTLTFPNRLMAKSFSDSLVTLGYMHSEICLCDSKITFSFCRSHTDHFGWFESSIRNFALWRDKILCKLFLWVTKPFYNSAEKILYLYFYLPICFRRMAWIRRYKKCRRHSS